MSESKPHRGVYECESTRKEKHTRRKQSPQEITVYTASSCEQMDEKKRTEIEREENF